MGAVLSTLGLASLVYGLIESASHGWASPPILGAFALFLLCLVVFLLRQSSLARQGRSPLMPLPLWRHRGFVAANVGGFGYFLAFFGILFFFSLLLQVERGYSPLTCGLAFLPMMGVMALVGPMAGRLIARHGSGPVLTAGLVVGAIGCLLLGLLSPHASLLDVEWRLGIMGAASGLLSSSASAGAVNGVDSQHRGIASAVHQSCRQIGSTMGVAALGVIVGSTTRPGFAGGLDHAMLAVAALLAVCAIVVMLLTGRPATGSSGA